MTLNELVLSNKERRFLNKIRKEKGIEITISVCAMPEIKAFITHGLIEATWSDSFQYETCSGLGPTPNCYIISDLGKRVILHNKRFTFIEFRAWFTLVVALSALVKSFFF